MSGTPDGDKSDAPVDIARAARRRRLDLKVVFTSGYPATGDGGLLEDDERAEFVRKPYRKAELAEKLAAVLSK